MGVVNLLCQTGKLKEALLPFWTVLVMYFMNISTLRKHSHYIGHKRHMANSDKCFLMLCNLFGKLGEETYLLKMWHVLYIISYPLLGWIIWNYYLKDIGHCIWFNQLYSSPGLNKNFELNLTIGRMKNTSVLLEHVAICKITGQMSWLNVLENTYLNYKINIIKKMLRIALIKCHIAK